ncbi:chloride channel protein [Segatella baroniae]|uniref:chloride channel protein n=1 Tax=Segatella baroniae TaxID=305719 RepID=UPI00040D6371|nr:chloride channel protein [Segatella baroniae]
MLILAFAIGFFASVAGYILHIIIHEIQIILTSRFDATTFNWLYLLFPVIGIWLTSLFVRHIVKDNISHGITRVLYAISAKQAKLKGHNCWSSVIASGITIGCGGSVGAEAPIVLTGSAIGSNLGKLFGMDNRQLIWLVGCGAAAAIAGIFKAPIAGLVFTLEVLMVDLTMASLLPILISCVTATGFTYIFAGDNSLFTFHLDNSWTLERTPACILLGVFCGFVSLYFMRAMNACENLFARMNNHPYRKLVAGGLILSTLIFLFPSLYGEGYNAVNTLLSGNTMNDWSKVMNNSLFAGNQNLLILYIGLVLITKVFATSATNGAGGCGGTFAPSLFIGGFAGFFFARIWNMNQIGLYIPEKNFTLMGMAGVMAGVMHAPLTGIFLIAELTGGYQLFMPLMIVCICSYLTINIFEPHSIYGMRLARAGKLITHHTDSAILTLMSLESIIDRQFESLDPDLPLGKLINVISKSHTSFLPVLDHAGTLLGEIDITKIRHVMFRSELYNRFTVSQIMTPVQATLGISDKMIDVMRKFESTNSNFLPVVDVNNQLKGYVSRTRMYSMYRKMVADFSSE